MIKLATLALLVAAPQTALAQGSRCVTRQEMTDVITFAAPIAVRTAATRCSDALPATAFLRTGGTQLAERLAGEAGDSGAAVVSVFQKMGGEKMPAGLSAETMQSLARDMLGEMLGKEIKPRSCGKVNALVESLAPLPARNLGLMMSSLLELTAKPGAKFSICPEPQP